jgi:hypothetical protein
MPPWDRRKKTTTKITMDTKEKEFDGFRAHFFSFVIFVVVFLL